MPEVLKDKVKALEEHYIEIEIHKDRDSIAGILDSLRNAGLDIADMQTTRADLEDVFLDITYGKAS